MEQDRLIETLSSKIRLKALVSLNGFGGIGPGWHSQKVYYKECCICYRVKKLDSLDCGHEFCNACIIKLKCELLPRCAMCRAPIHLQ